MAGMGQNQAGKFKAGCSGIKKVRLSTVFPNCALADLGVPGLVCELLELLAVALNAPLLLEATQIAVRSKSSYA